MQQCGTLVIKGTVGHFGFSWNNKMFSDFFTDQTHRFIDHVLISKNVLVGTLKLTEMENVSVILFNSLQQSKRVYRPFRMYSDSFTVLHT